MLRSKIRGVLVTSVAFVLYLTLSGFSIFHDIHITYGTAELYTNKLSVKITIFTDDLRRAIDKWYGKPTTDVRCEEQYIKSHLRFWSGERQITLIVTSHEEGQSTVLDCTASLDSRPSTLTIDNQVLLAIYGDQMNLMHVKLPAEEREVIFKNGSTTLRISV